MSHLHHQDDIFIAEYTLGLLEQDQLAKAHSLLSQDDAAAGCALQWEERLLSLTDALTPLHPSDRLLQRIQATLGLPVNKQTPTPASTPQSGMGLAMGFEPRLIRPDTASVLSNESIPSAPGVAPAPQDRSKISTATPAEKPAALSAQPARVRAAPPDPMEAFRPDANARPPRPALWRSLWFWRSLSTALAVLAAVLALPETTFRQDPTVSAPLQPPAAPAPQIVQVAIMQAPGTSSTPGWILTVDSRQNVILAPQVDIVVPETESVYLWTYNEQSPRPRLLGLVDPQRSLTLPMEVTGQVSPGQFFEMTQEPSQATPQEPDGPILFIGRTVSLG
ncbi:MAG TPA: anti-sigma factor [Pusillimonas sp.]|uniref:anti-sigma factor domain-containing protein n=1 Tax=Pusillimonas sp. TaxID=3040095 RepID=UPI002BF53F26|nr:anti-sigma factor [Pusillimonas sp.]HUH88570.1 anti-sigma factor [Pusillimonas sp.]